MDYQRIKDFLMKRECLISENDYTSMLCILEKLEKKEQPQQIEESDRIKALGNKAYGEGRLEDALNFYTQAIEAYPRNVFAYSNRALVYSKLNRDEEGIQDCLDGIKIDPAFIKFYIRIGQLYSKTDNEKAIYYFKEGLAREPENTRLQELVKQTEEKDGKSSMLSGLTQYLQSDKAKDTVKDFLKDKSMEDVKGMFGSMFNKG